MSKPRKNLSSFFHQIMFKVFKTVRLKKVYSAIVAHLFFHRNVPDGKFLIGFAYSFKQVGLRANLMSCFSFLSQKTYPGEFVRPEVVLSRSYLRKCSIWLGLPPIINLSFFENTTKSELFEVRG